MEEILACVWSRIKGKSLSNLVGWSYTALFNNQGRDVCSIINNGEWDFTGSNLPANIYNTVQEIKIYGNNRNDEWEWTANGGNSR